MGTSPAGSPSPRSWRDAAGSPARGRAPKSKRRRIFQLFAAFLVVAGVLIAFLWSLRQPPTLSFRPIYVTEHTNQLIPVNGQARQDQQALLGGNYFPNTSKDLSTIQERQRLREELDALKKQQPDQTLLVYVSGAVLCDARGELHLLPGDADIDNPSTWFRLRDILDGVQACPARHKLLVLDIMRPLADPRLGVLVNDVAQRVEQLLQETKEMNYRVLCACSPGQTTLVSEELGGSGRSVFGYYFEQGLRGWADGCLNSRADGRVTVEELAAFLKTRVDLWADRNRSKRQTLKLYGTGPDFELVSLPRGKPRPKDSANEDQSAAAAAQDTEKKPQEPGDKGNSDQAASAKAQDDAKGSTEKKSAPPSGDEGKADASQKAGASGAMDSYPKWLAAGWALRDAWWKDRTFAVVPVVFRQLEAHLLLAENHWRGGTPADKARDVLSLKLRELQAEVEQVRKALPQPEEARSLALARALGKKTVPPAVEAAVPDLITRLNSLPRDASSEPPKEGSKEPKEPGKDLQTELAERFLTAFKVKTGDSLQLRDPSGFELAWAVFAAAAGDPNIDRTRIRFLHDLLEKQRLDPRLETQYVETLFLHRLKGLSDQSDRDHLAWPGDAVRRALHVVQEGEQATALAAAGQRFEPRAFPWIKGLLEEAAQERHDGEVLLFARGYASAQKAEETLRNAEDKYRLIKEYLEVLHDALGAYDEGMVLLPGYASYHAEADKPDQEAWEQSLGQIEKLYRVLAPPPEAGSPAADQLSAWINELRETTSALRVPLERLTRPFTKDLPALLARVKHPRAGADDYRQAQAALSLPWLAAAGRAELWTETRKLGQRLLQSTPDVDQPVPELSPFDARKFVQQEWEHAARRGQVLLELFRLGGLDTGLIDGWQKKLTEARQHPELPAAWPALAQELRQAWAQLASKLPQEAGSSGASWGQDRFARIVHPFDSARLPADAERSASVQVRRTAGQAYWRWLCDRYQYEGQDFKVLKLDVETPVFFTGTADRYLADARVEDPRPQTRAYFKAVAGTQRPNLRDGRRAADYQFQIELDQRSGSPAALKDLRSVQADDDWLQVEAQKLATPAGPVIAAVAVVRLKPEADTTATPAPQGFLLQAVVNGRSFHHKVPVNTPPLASERLQLLFSERPEQEPGAMPAALRLRPNVEQKEFLWAYNPSKLAHQVEVELRTQGQESIRSQPVNLGPGEKKRVIFTGKEPMPNVPLPALAKPELELFLWEVGKTPALDKKLVRIETMRPGEYVEVVQAPRYLRQDGKMLLLAQVKASRDLAGGPCPVELVLSPQRIPSLLRDSKKGNREEDLSKSPSGVTLTAEELELDDRSENNGEVSLTVDHYERAFVYKITFAPEGGARATRLGGRPIVKLPPLLLSRPNVLYELPLDVYSGDRPVNIELSVDRQNGDNFKQQDLKPGERDQHVAFTPSGPQGCLQFQTRSEPWKLKVDTRGFTGGDCKVRVRLLDADAKQQIGEAAVATLRVDGTAPDEKDLQFLTVNNTKVGSSGAPLRLQRASTLVFTLEGRDPESGIKRVRLYLGAPDNNQPPKGAEPVPADPLKDDKTRWKAVLPLAGDFKGVFKVSAEFVNNVDLASVKTLALEFYDPPPPTAATKGSVEAVVKLGDNRRPEVKVKLEAQGISKEKKTGDDGNVQFDDLTPGKYKLSARESGREASAEVEVTAGKATSVTLELRLK